MIKYIQTLLYGGVIFKLGGIIMYKDNKELQDETREEDEMISNILTLTNLYMMNRIEFKKKVFKKNIKMEEGIKDGK